MSLRVQAKRLRSRQTEAEQRLWYQQRARGNFPGAQAAESQPPAVARTDFPGYQAEVALGVVLRVIRQHQVDQAMRIRRQTLERILGPHVAVDHDEGSSAEPVGRWGELM